MENAIMRNYRIDNIKFFLIFCVVLGHSMELFNAGGGIESFIRSICQRLSLFQDTLHNLTERK